MCATISMSPYVRMGSKRSVRTEAIPTLPWALHEPDQRSCGHSNHSPLCCTVPWARDQLPFSKRNTAPRPAAAVDQLSCPVVPTHCSICTPQGLVCLVSAGPLGLTHTWVSVDDSFALNELGRGKADLQQPRPEVHVSVCELLEHVEEELGHLLALALDQVQNFADLVAAQA